MGEKGNVADVRTAGGHVASATQRAHDLGLGSQALSGSGAPSGGGDDGGGILSDIADIAKDKATDVGLGRGGASGIIGGKRDEDDDDEA